MFGDYSKRLCTLGYSCNAKLRFHPTRLPFGPGLAVACHKPPSLDPPKRSFFSESLLCLTIPVCSTQTIKTAPQGFVEITEKQFPGFQFSGRWNLTLGGIGPDWP